jgi:hypothetical protein
VAIRGLQAEVLSGAQLQVAGAGDPAREERAGIQWQAGNQRSPAPSNGKPWVMPLPGGAQPLQLRQYRRIEGVVDLPPQAVVQNVSAKVVEGAVTRAAQGVKL